MNQNNWQRPFLLGLAACWFLVSCVAHSDERKTKNLSNTEFELLTLHNNIRIEGLACQQRLMQAPKLRWSRKLAKAARLHSSHMHKAKTLNHGKGRKKSTKGRLKTVKYAWAAYAENVATGANTPHSVIALWKANPAHCRNLISSDYQEMGAAEQGGYWTVIYASPK